MATNNFTVGNRLSKMGDAAKVGFEKANVITGAEQDPELAMYGKLKKEHFDELTKQYGAEAVTDYIKNMESKKMARKIGR